MTPRTGNSATFRGGSPSISVVLFDLDDTLFAHRRAVDLGVAAHLRAIGRPLAEGDAEAELARWHALEEHHYHRYLGGELDFLGQRLARARSFVEPYGVELTDEAAAEWFDGYLVEYRRAWSLHDDAGACLDALAALRLGVITNGDAAFQSAKIETMGLTARFEHLIASGDVGVAKPDARIFARACEVFGVEPPAAAYVGDRLHTDALGAAAAGLLGVWLDRSADAAASDLELAQNHGVCVIHSLAELPPLLGH